MTGANSTLHELSVNKDDGDDETGGDATDVCDELLLGALARMIGGGFSANSTESRSGNEIG